MQLGKALIGAIIGAALGIGVLVAIYLLFKLDAVTLAIPVALLTGLGVRMLVSTSGHASYARGALTGVLAMAAYLGGWYVVAGLATQQARAQSKQPVPGASAERSADDKETDEAPAEEVKAPVERPQPTQRTNVATMPKGGAPGQNPWDYVWLGVAALVAYELGRGTAAKPVEVVRSEGGGGT